MEIFLYFLFLADVTDNKDLQSSVGDWQIPSEVFTLLKPSHLATTCTCGRGWDSPFCSQTTQLT